MNICLQLISLKKALIYCLLFLIFLQLQSNVFAQIKFSGISSSKQIGKNEYLQVEYKVENAASVTRITPPAFKNFTIVSGPNQQSGMTSINGVVNQYVSIGFVLKPATTGTINIAPATAVADGKQYRSNILQVTVSNSLVLNSPGGNSASPFANITLDALPRRQVHEYDDYILHKGENLAEKIRKNMFVKVDVTKTSCYVGEPIVATYKLFTRLKSESNLTKSPSFNGFSVSDLEKPDNYSLHTEKLNGREYNVYLLRKVQLYPLQPGIIELESSEVENKITFIKAEYADAQKGDIFYDMLRDFADAATPQSGIEEQRVTLQSKPVTIEVKPLPEENKPDNFKGAVGNFKIDAVADKNNIAVDDVNNLRIIISGTGNIQMINSPEFSLPDGLEAFESKSAEKLDKMSVPVKGVKIFTYPFTAAKPSTYNIPPVTFSYFDINTKTYKTIASKAITLNVKKGTGRKGMNIFKQVYNKIPETFTDRIYEIRWFLIAGGLVMAILLFWFIKKRKQEKLQQVAKDEKREHESKGGNHNQEKAIADKLVLPDDALKLPRERLEQKDSKLFYNSLDHALRKYLSAKLEFPSEEFGRKRINELLDRSNVGIGTTLMLNSLLEDIELNLYAPFASADQMQEVYSKASEVVALLDKQMTG